MSSKEYRHQYYLAHKDRHREQMTAWRKKNRDRHNEMTADWYLRNRERHLAASKKWSANNLDLKAAYRRRRRARLAAASGDCTLEQAMARVEFHGGICVYCGAPFQELDHAIPLSRGGSNWPANIVPACRPCNRRKHTKTWKEFCCD